MTTKLPVYLRTLRRRWGFTQKELALLVPRGRRTRVSDVERGKTPPRADELLAYALIFGVPPEALFRAYADAVADKVVRGCAELEKRFERGEGKATPKKLELLRQARQRAQAFVHLTPPI